MTELRVSDEKIDRLLRVAPAPELAAELSGKISGMLKASLRPVQPMPGTNVLTLQFASVFLVLAMALIGMMGVTGFRTLHLWQVAGIVAILALGVTLLSVALAWQIRPGSLKKISAPVSWLCFGLGFLTGAALLFPWRTAEAWVFPVFAAHGIPCLLTGSAVAVPGGIVFWMLSRRGVPLSATAFGGSLGAMAGLLGVTVLQFRCIYQNAAHLMVWHGGVLLVTIAAGVVSGRLMHHRNQTRRASEGMRVS
jgi:hypothetical protein